MEKNHDSVGMKEDFYCQCIEDAKRSKSRLSQEALSVPGLTSPFIRHLINNLCSDGQSYLEIGSLLGATVVAASYGNRGDFYAVDNYSKWPLFNSETCGMIPD